MECYTDSFTNTNSCRCQTGYVVKDSSSGRNTECVQCNLSNGDYDCSPGYTCSYNNCVPVKYAFLGVTGGGMATQAIYEHRIINGAVEQTQGPVAADHYLDSGNHNQMPEVRTVGRSPDGSALFASLGDSNSPATIIGCSVSYGAVTGCAVTATSFPFFSHAVTGFAFTSDGTHAYMFTLQGNGDGLIIGCGTGRRTRVWCRRRRLKHPTRPAGRRLWCVRTRSLTQNPSRADGTIPYAPTTFCTPQQTCQARRSQTASPTISAAPEPIRNKARSFGVTPSCWPRTPRTVISSGAKERVSSSSSSSSRSRALLFACRAARARAHTKNRARGGGAATPNTSSPPPTHSRTHRLSRITPRLPSPTTATHKKRRYALSGTTVTQESTSQFLDSSSNPITSISSVASLSGGGGAGQVVFIGNSAGRGWRCYCQVTSSTWDCADCHQDLPSQTDFVTSMAFVGTTGTAVFSTYYAGVGEIGACEISCAGPLSCTLACSNSSPSTYTYSNGLQFKSVA